jgi:tellurite resistance protein
LTTCVLYIRYAAADSGALRRDLEDMTAGPFASLAVITPVVLAADGLAPYSRGIAAVVIDVFVVLTLLLGGWFTGFWMRGGTDLERLHPGYLLPTVAGGFIAAAALADVGQVRFGQVMLGLGVLCWAIVGSMILLRLIFRSPLADSLIPTMAIEVAPAAVASLALFASSGGRVTVSIAMVAGYGLLMVAAQLPLLPRYVRLGFSISIWAFTFSPRVASPQVVP